MNLSKKAFQYHLDHAIRYNCIFCFTFLCKSSIYGGNILHCGVLFVWKCWTRCTERNRKQTHEPK